MRRGARRQRKARRSERRLGCCPRHDDSQGSSSSGTKRGGPGFPGRLWSVFRELDFYLYFTERVPPGGPAAIERPAQRLLTDTMSSRERDAPPRCFGSQKVLVTRSPSRPGWLLDVAR